MPFCPRCLQPLHESARFCSQCGSSAIPTVDDARGESESAITPEEVAQSPRHQSSTISFWKVLGAVVLALIFLAFLRGMIGNMTSNSQPQGGDSDTAQGTPAPVAPAPARKPHVVFETSG